MLSKAWPIPHPQYRPPRRVLWSGAGRASAARLRRAATRVLRGLPRPRARRTPGRVPA